jgi:hypothetical protein
MAVATVSAQPTMVQLIMKEAFQKRLTQMTTTLLIATDYSIAARNGERFVDTSGRPRTR